MDSIKKHNPSTKGKTYQRCWSFAIEYRLDVFHNQCDDKASTLTVYNLKTTYKNELGEVFVAYTDKPWTSEYL